MTSRYPPPVLNIFRSTAERFLPTLVALVSGIALQPVSAEPASPAPVLQPYTARYQTTARGFELNVTRSLEVDSAGQFVLSNGGKILVVGFHEISVFRVEDGVILPRSYVYRGTGMVNRRRELQFSPEQGKIRSLYKDKWYDLPYAETTMDRMNQVEQLRLALLQDPEAVRDITLRVADGKRVKDSHLVLIAEDVVQTPLGPVPALHYQRLHSNPARTSDVWFAPQWDYLMVKTVHIEDGDPVEMILASATLNGEPVTLN